MSTKSTISRTEAILARIFRLSGISAIIAIGSKLQYETGVSITDENDIPNKAYVDNLIFSTVPEINAITIGSPNPYTYEYSGQFGTKPSVTTVQDMGSGVYRKRDDITIDIDTINSNIIARGDFSEDQIEIWIKP